MPTLLVIDDDRSVLHLVRRVFDGSDVGVLAASSAHEGMELLEGSRPDVVLLDILLPETSGLDAFERISQIDPKLPVIFITADGSSDTAIEAMKLGAYDYLLKPLDAAKVDALVRQALEIRRLRHVPVGLPDKEPMGDEGDLLVGRSPQMVGVYKSIGRVAPQDVTVLVSGESGTGKELVARAIYHHSERAEKPFLAVNCAAIPETLLESELFGHEKGSFTGAEKRRIGKFEQATGGTIFLDEVGDMSPLVQGKVLRVLEDQQFERVGGNETIETDVRIVAASNKNLERMVAEGKFRSDLYYRLNGFSIKLPPLRERGDDILLLLEHFLARFNEELEKDVHGISPEALAMLVQYRWPGNVRELQTVLKQAMLQATGPVLISAFLPEEIRTGHASETPDADGDAKDGDLKALLDERLEIEPENVYAAALEMMERYVVSRVLRFTDGNQSRAAKILGITRGSLRNKIRSLGISIGQVVSVEEEPERALSTPA